MKKIEAPTLEEAYILASKEFNCSITELEIEVIQNARKGVFGIGKKNAIIIANSKNTYEHKKPTYNNKPKITEIKPEVKEKKEYLAKVEKSEIKPNPTPSFEYKSSTNNNEIKETKKNVTPTSTDIFHNFYGEKKNIYEIANDIEKELERLFKCGCFDLNKIKVTLEDESTLLIEFDGKDAALLIGKEGYRYKALSYMLFNWINPKYNLMVKLEIAEFLKNQEEMIKNYLIPLIDNIKSVGYGQTKPLDGVLAHIALKQLRNIFPNKYVIAKENDDGIKYVIVTDFKK
jgi:spoIIIJ-associated protein